MTFLFVCGQRGAPQQDTWWHHFYQLKNSRKLYLETNPWSNLVAAASFAVDAGVLARHNLYVVGSDGDAGGAIITGQAAKNGINNNQSHYVPNSLKF